MDLTTRKVILTIEHIAFLDNPYQDAFRVQEEYHKVAVILTENNFEYDEDIEDNYVLAAYTIRVDITGKPYEKIKDLIDKLSFLKKDQITIAEEYTIVMDRTKYFMEDTNV